MAGITHSCMAVKNGNNQITLPDVVRAGDGITAKWANSIRKAIQDLRDRKPQQSKKGNIARIAAPFTPYVKYEDGAWKIMATRGLVVERQLSAGEGSDALFYHAPDNLLTAGEPTWFTIADGQSLFVKVLETTAGVVNGGADLIFVVLSSTTESTNYIPSTQDGIYYYKICEFTIVSGKPVVKRFCAGSNIFHETGLTHDTQFMTCEDPIYFTQTQLGRLSFTSGRLVAVNADVADRPLAPSNQQIDIASCS